jgi:hypothetical protein
VTLDVFLESFDVFDRDAVEVALARNGIAGDDAPVETADGGSALVTVDDETCTFFIKSLTPDLAQIILDVGRAARLAILPADGTATTILPRRIDVPEDLEPVRVRTVAQLHEALRQGVTRREAMRGTPPA